MTTNPSHNGENANPGTGFRAAEPVERGGAVLVALEGEFDLSAVPAFEAVTGTVPADRHLAVDLRELGYIDSTGISSLLRLDARLREGGGKLECVLPPEGPVRRVFDLVRLGETIAVSESPPA
jgi:anti-anti-sigma factor